MTAYLRCIVIAVGALFAFCTGTEGKRIALVIGNDAYVHLPALEKATGDARAMGLALKDLGFDVSVQENLDFKTFEAVLAAFENRIAHDDEVVFHFSGHGVAVNQQNYLLPVDLQEAVQESRLKRLAFNAAELIENLRTRQPRWVFAVLDACRDNPFLTTVRGGLTRGLVRTQSEFGSFVLHSAGPGQTARDRLGTTDPEPTSVFTRVLLKHLKTPGLRFYDLAKATQGDVATLAATVNHRQFPEIVDNVRGQPVLNLAVATDPAPESDRSRPAPSVQAGPADEMTEPLAMLRTRQGDLEGEVYSIAYSPDGRTIAAGNEDNSVTLWDVGSGTLLKTLTAGSRASRPVFSVKFSADGRTIVTGDTDGLVKLWDLRLVALRESFKGQKSRVYSVAFSPDGRTIAAGGMFEKYAYTKVEDDTVKLLDATSGNLLASLEGHESSVNSVVFSPDGQTIASGSNDNSVKLWDVRSQGPLKTFEGHDGWVYSVAFSPDGRTIASASGDNSVKLWDVASGRLLKSFEGHGQPVRSVAFSPDGRTIASGGEDTFVKLWDVASGAPLKSLEGHTHTITSVTFSPDGRTVASGGWDGIRLWNVPEGSLVNVLQLLPGGSWVAIGRGGYVASPSAHDFLRLDAGDGTLEPVNNAFRQTWLKKNLRDPSGKARDPR